MQGFEQFVESIGAVSRSFIYAEPPVAKLAWEKANAIIAGRNVSVWRGHLPDERHRQFVLVMGEADNVAQINHVARILEETAESEIRLPEPVINAMRNRRRQLARDGLERRTHRWGEQGVEGDRHGNVYPRRNQG